MFRRVRNQLDKIKASELSRAQGRRGLVLHIWVGTDLEEEIMRLKEAGHDLYAVWLAHCLPFWVNDVLHDAWCSAMIQTQLSGSLSIPAQS